MKFRSLFWIIALAAPAWAEDYCFGFLNTHPERTEIPESQAQEIQKGHMAHMNSMAMAGHLLAAGPFMTPGGPRGVVLYRCESLGEAIEWTKPDPAVQNKRLAIEMHRWRGPAGIGEPLMSQLKANPDTKYQMVQLPLVILRKAEKWTNEPNLVGSLVSDLSKDGNLRAAGPVLDGGEVAGILVFRKMPIEEAKALVEASGMVKQGQVRAQALVWFVADTVLPGAKP